VSYEPPGYLPGNYSPGGPAAPPYGRPPRKSRAGLIIALMLALLIAVLGVGGVVTYRLVSDWREDSSSPDPGTSAAPAVTSPTPQRSIPAPQPTKPPATKPPTTKPAANVSDLGRRFVAQLNANNPTGAAALACESSKQLVRTLMEVQLEPPTKLTTGTPIGQQLTFVIPLSGTTKGSTVSGVVVIHQLGTEPLCVRAFSLNAR
jgi:hypothetical protein